MTRMVMCSRFKKELPGLEAPPFPGPNGEQVFENVSAQAWQDWQTLQTMLINEKKMNMMNPDDRAFLEQAMVAYLFEGKEPDIEGFVPEKK